MKLTARVVVVFVVAAAFGTSVLAQQGKHPGIVLYDQNKFAEAISSLRQALGQKEFAGDAELHNFLGLALVEIGNPKEARKSLEKAVKLAPDKTQYRVNLAYAYLSNRQINKAQTEIATVFKTNPKSIAALYLEGISNLWEGKFNEADSDADQILAIDPAYPEAYIMKSDVLTARLGNKIAGGSDIADEIGLLLTAKEILAMGVEKSKAARNFEKLESEYESISTFYNYFKNRKPIVPGTVSAPEPGVTALKIISKAPPSYTESARQARVQGKIQVAVLFSATGRVENVLVLKGLGYGLDQKAVEAARKVVFEPKLQDGKPVSTVKLLEYSFSIF